MMPASNQGLGTNTGFPDVCTTPAAPSPVPIPYPNIGMNAMAVPFCPNIFTSFVPAHNMGAKPAMTNGDNAGVAHPLCMQPGGTTMGNPKILLTGMPAEHLLVPTNGNNFNNPVGAKTVPSVTNVLMASLGATAPTEEATRWTPAALETLAREVHDLQAPSLGITTAWTAHGLLVVHVRRDGPAQVAGVRPGDLLVEIDGERASTLGELPLPEPGRDIALRVSRGGASLALTARWDGSAAAVSGELVSGRVGLLTVRRFSLRLADWIDAEVERLVGAGARSLVLDLRGNPGGALTAAVKTAGLFLPRGSTFARLQLRDGRQQVLCASGSERWSRLPLVVLIDGQTASAGEVLAAAFQDHGRALVVGSRSFGKGRGETPGGLLTALLRTDGASLQGVGVVPDVTAAPEDARAEAVRAALGPGARR